MKFIKFIVERKVLIGLLLLFVVILGSYSTFKLDKELMPEVTMDGAYIEIDAGDLPAAEVERTITSQLEQQLVGMDGIKDINSTSNIGSSFIQITFEQGKGDDLFQEFESIANAAIAEIPNINDSAVEQFGTSQSYEFFIDVSGGSMEEMTAFAKNILEPRLEDLSEVRDVNLTGLLQHEVAIEFDQNKLTNNNLDITNVIQTIQEVNNEATLGELTNDEGSPSIRWNTKYEELDDINNIKLASPTGDVVKLDDVASISLKPLANASYVWKNGTKDFILVQIGRNANITQIEMANAVRSELKKIRAEKLENGLEINEMVAQADYVEEAIDGVTSNILIGGVIALVVLLLFLRNLRATFIIGLAIPTAILLTFVTMWLIGYSFNMLSLIGLGLGIGMLVDASIVILESIYKKKELGFANMEAILHGTKEVANAVIASVLTTIAVFLPIGMIGGEMGQLMIVLSAVVAITLISSVIIAFTLIPSLSDKLLNWRKPKQKYKKGFLINFYSSIVAWTIKKRRYSFAVILLFLAIFIGSLFLITRIPMNIMPDIYNRYTELMINTEAGLSPSEKEKLVEDVHKKLHAIEDVESNYVMDNSGLLYVIINMTKNDAITREQKDVNEDILRSLRELKETHPITDVQSALSAGSGSSVQVNIKGEDFDQLQTVAANFKKELQEIDGIVEVNHSMERTSKEQVINIKKKKLEEMGLTEQQLKQLLEQTFLQLPIGELEINDETVPIVVNWQDKKQTEKAFLSTTIPGYNGEEKFSSIVTLKQVETPNEITRIDGDRSITITADIEGKDLGTVNVDVQKAIDQFKSELPSDYSINVAGDLEQQQQLMKDMAFVLLLALFLVYFVMAVQFNHLGHPLIVMAIIPMTIVGVILGLFLTNMELNLMSGIGVIMVIGIVLNNAILLIDRINQLKKDGLPIEEAIITAGENRIRPIFMTTLTTAGGMLPLALASGTSGHYQAPMATVIISGLMFATFITLLLIPAILRLFTSTKLSYAGKKVEQKKAKGAYQPASGKLG